MKNPPRLTGAGSAYGSVFRAPPLMVRAGCAYVNMQPMPPRPAAAVSRLAQLRRQVERLEAIRGKVVAGQAVSASALLDALDTAREAVLVQVRQAKAEVGRLRAGRAG